MTDEDVLLPIGEEENEAPEDLPEVSAQATIEVEKLIPDAGRICPSCKREASRVVSNLLGRQAYCGPCKIDWPIGPPVAAIAPPIMGRSVAGKQTHRPPDWSLAYEDVDPTGPK